jgi:4-hydroxybenzoate polyprenyltransferase
MDSTTATLLRELATKLGTTSEYLWRVLLKQAFISGISDIIYYIALTIATIYLFWLHKKFSVENEKKQSLYYKKEWIILPMGAAGFILIIALLCAIGNIPDTIAALVNPEYWALDQILHKVKD